MLTAKNFRQREKSVRVWSELLFGAQNMWKTDCAITLLGCRINGLSP